MAPTSTTSAVRQRPCREQQSAATTQPAICDPLQRKNDILIDVVDADHEAAVLIEQQTVARQEEARGHGEQKHGAEAPQEVALQRAREAQLA